MNVLTQKYAGIPGWVWLAGAGLVAWYLLSHTGGSSATDSGAFTPSQSPVYTTNTSAPSSGASTPAKGSGGWWDSLTPKQRKQVRADERKAGRVKGA